MKTIILAILAAMLLVQPARAMDKSDILLECTYQALHAADWYTTVSGVNNGSYEVNPLIGRHPSDTKMHAYFAASAVAHALVVYMVPKGWRDTLQSISLNVKWSLVDHNYNVDSNPRAGWQVMVSWNN